MPKKLFKRIMPKPEKLREIKALHFLGDILHEPNLWHINRHAVSRAMFIGLFWAMMPMPFQMVPAALFAIWFNANLPLSIALVWLTNPLTMPPIFYANYWVGAWVLDRPPLPMDFEMSWAWLSTRLVEIGIPLYLGSIINGVVIACGAYVSLQFAWQRKIRHDWRKRQETRRLSPPNT